jgi:hypothetical protein
MSDGPPRPTTPLAMQSELLSIGAPPLSVGKVHVATSDEAVEVLTLGAPPPSSALGRTARDVATNCRASKMLGGASQTVSKIRETCNGT